MSKQNALGCLVLMILALLSGACGKTAQPVTVPNVVGMTQAAAETTITNATLTVGTVTEQHHPTIPAGQVISQNPASGSSVAPGTAVALVVSDGPAPVPVPNVVGTAQVDAETAITNATLTVGTVTEQHHPTIPAGQVISQNPASGSSVAPGTAVALVVSDGPAPVTVPNVVTMAQATAQTTITDANLTVGTVTEQHHATIPFGHVISQNPASGSSVAPGTAVALVVSDGPAPVNVPNVVGSAQADAQTAITNATLTVGTVTEQHHATIPAGQVISQNPASGSSVAPGTAVALVVSDGPPAPPQANFDANVTSGCAPLTVNFTDLSVPGDSPITAWSWDFGDGDASEEQNPIHVYETPGTYDVSLTVTTVVGNDTKTETGFIAVVDEKTVMLPGDVPLEMVWIPSGTFMMGRNPAEQDSYDEEDQQHQVTLTRGFWMGKYEVTQAQWQAVMGGNPSHFTGDLNRPVEMVSWNNCQAFIMALNTANPGMNFCLPTEAEWEYACRAGTTTRFYWGDDLSYTQINNYAWYATNGESTTHPVGQKLPNAFGLYDMSGNVLEMVQDWYSTSYTSDSVLDPTGPATGSTKVIRGGSWSNDQIWCRSAFRNNAGPNDLNTTCGFRLTRSYQAAEADFEADLTSGSVPLTVNFTDLSVPGDSPITAWSWDFGDGDASEEQNPTHVYETPGTYDVSLTVTTDVGNDTKTETGFITVVDEKTVMLPGDVPLEMVWVSAGSFMMGAYPGEQDSSSSDEPQHEVTLSEGFWIGKYELTKRQWQAVMGTTPWAGQSDVLSDLDSPAGYVSWNDAKAFVAALSADTGLAFQLPSEAQWEYACRAGTETRFYWGDDPSYTDINNYAWHQGNTSPLKACVVGQKLPNALGLFDMSGNAYEWCEDYYGPYSEEPVTDPSGPEAGTLRVLRGGTVVHIPRDCRSAIRNAYAPTVLNGKVGFRLVSGNLSPPPQADFSADITSGDVPLTVCFTDLSAPGDSPITAWSWDFGDGGESDEQNPTYTYETPGTYDVSLTVTTDIGENTKTEVGLVAVGGEETIVLPGNVPLEMVWIPEGTFMMGRNPGEQGSWDREDPQHQVTVSGFWMGTYELTKRQWQAVMGTTPWSGQDYVLSDPDSPAVWVSWNDAKAFITALNSYTGLTFRLPSEAEWEYACRAGTTTAFYWGDDPTRTVGDAYCWWTSNTWNINERYAHVVGLKQSNEFGLYDMSGNVWEWCEDDWHTNYTGAPTDGSAWIGSPRGSLRMLRGGYWNFSGDHCRSAERNGANPSSTGQDSDVGFRLSR